MLVLAQTGGNMADDGLTNLNWLVQHNPIAPLAPSTPPASVSSPLPCSASNSSSTSSENLNSGATTTNLVSQTDYSRERIKPPYSYAQMITMAMEAHGGRKVLLTDIYAWIRDNFAYFRGNDTSWQNSVRHNLSLNKQFVKVPRDPKDKGKGSYWKLDASGCNLAKDPYCLRRRNFADAGASSRRVHRPEVSHPQVNPAIKTFLERVRRLQEARRHPFAGTGEIVEDIGAQECVYADTEPLFDDFNRKLFKKDVELYDPGGYCPLISTSRLDARKRLDSNDLTSADSTADVERTSSESRAKVRVEYNWEAYEYHPSNVSGAQLPLEPEPTRLDLRIPTPEWWATNLSATHNLLLSPNNTNNPMVKVFENLNNNNRNIIANADTLAETTATSCADAFSPCRIRPDEPTVSVSSVADSRHQRIRIDGSINDFQKQSVNDAGDRAEKSRAKIAHPWTDDGPMDEIEADALLLDLDYSSATKLTVN